jgi:hypothetical protein
VLHGPGGLVVDPARRTATRHGVDLGLTKKELGVLEVLLAAEGAVVSSEELLERVWDEFADPFTTTVRVTVMTLRKKLGSRGSCTRSSAPATGSPRTDAVTEAARRCGGADAGLRRGGADGRALLLLLSLVLVERALSTTILGAGNVGVALPTGRAAHLRRSTRTCCARRRSPRCCARACSPAAARRARASPSRTTSPGRVLQPLQDITAAAQRLSAERLDARIALAGPEDELKQLADTFDDMLGRLEAAFEAQRRFVADASHELRTPLAVMRTEVEVALADPAASADDLRAAALVVRDATVRADRLVDSLLLLAQSERCRPGVRERVELPEVAAQALAPSPARCRSAACRSPRRTAPAGVLGDRGPARAAGRQPRRERRPAQRRRRLGCAWTPAPSRGRARLEVSNSGACSRRRRWPGCSSRSAGTAPRAPPGGAPAWGWRSCGRSPSCTAAPSRAGPARRAGLTVTVDLPRSP